MVCLVLCIYRKGDATVGNPRRARIVQFELFELVLLLRNTTTNTTSNNNNNTLIMIIMIMIMMIIYYMIC